MDALRLRETDCWIRDEHGKQALSVSSTGIAVTAWRAAALLSAFYAMDNAPLDRVQGPVREAYPGAAVVAWQLLDPKETESYKKSTAVLRAAAGTDGSASRLAAADQAAA